MTKKTSTLDARVLETPVPPRLFDQLQQLVSDGWYGSIDEIVRDALRRYLNTHRPEIMERHLREDVEWGLRGTN